MRWPDDEIPGLDLERLFLSQALILHPRSSQCDAQTEPVVFAADFCLQDPLHNFKPRLTLVRCFVTFATLSERVLCAVI